MSHEAEQATLGSMILDNNCISLVSELLTADMFRELEHRTVFTGILDLDGSGTDIDGLQVRNMGVSGRIALQIMESVPSAASVEYYAKIVLEDYKVFRLKELSTQVELITREDIKPDDMISKVQVAVTKHTEHTDTQVVDHVGDIAKTVKFGVGGSKRIPTGFTAIDDVIIGIGNADYVLVAGRPGMGKTALMVDIAVNMSWGNEIPVAFYSCEMTPEQLVMRMASARCGVPLFKVEKGFAKPDEIDSLYEAARQMSKCPMYIKSAGGTTPMALKRKILSDKRKYGIQAVFVDYLQLMKPDEKTSNGYEKITNISRAIKPIILQTETPIIMGSQLKRLEDDKKPNLTSFRGSGAIEEDADIVIGLHRENYYNPDKPANDAQALILKGKHFGTGIADLRWEGPLTHFEDKIWQGSF